MANDTWRTPKEIYDHYNKRFNFVCDVCASEENALNANFITERENYLLIDAVLFAPHGSYVWCNPPYSNPKPFVQKAIEDSQTRGVGCVFLLNHDMSTKWAVMLSEINCTHEVIVGKRVSFLDGKGNAIRGNNRPQFVAIIPPYVRKGDPIVKYVTLDSIMEAA